MPMQKWYPINPLLTRDNEFVALAYIPDKEQRKPVALPPGTHLGKSYVIIDRFEVSDVATLGVMSIVTAAQSLNAVALVHDAVKYTEVWASPPGKQLVTATRWGAGFRATLLISDFSAKVDVNTSWAAVAAEIGLANVSLSIEAFGIGEPSLLAKLPKSGRFDHGTAKQLDAAEKALAAYLDTPGARLTPVPFAVQMSEPPSVPPQDDARAYLFAMRQLKRGTLLKDALHKAKERGFFLRTVRSAYQALVPGVGDATQIPSTVKDVADAWLDATDP